VKDQTQIFFTKQFPLNRNDAEEGSPVPLHDDEERTVHLGHSPAPVHTVPLPEEVSAENPPLHLAVAVLEKEPHRMTSTLVHPPE
jgi:hypothetical protein